MSKRPWITKKGREILPILRRNIMIKKTFLMVCLATVFMLSSLQAQGGSGRYPSNGYGRRGDPSRSNDRGFGAQLFADEATARQAAQGYIDANLDGYTITQIDSSERGVDNNGAAVVMYRAQARDASGNAFYIFPSPGGVGAKITPAKVADTDIWSEGHPAATGVTVNSSETAKEAASVFISKILNGYTVQEATPSAKGYNTHEVKIVDSSENIFYLFVTGDGFVRGFIPEETRTYFQANFRGRGWGGRRPENWR